MGIQRHFNNTLSLTFPDGFHVMNNDERKKLKMLADGPGECLTDPDRHIIISIGWKELGLFPALLVSVKDAADNSQKAIRLRTLTERKLPASATNTKRRVSPCTGRPV